jgi:hypothetical protein
MKALPIGAAARRHWIRIFDRIRRGHAVSWDFQWQLAMWSQHGLAAVADANLISNIGFGAAATHTTLRTWHAEMPTMTVQVTGHPDTIIPCQAADMIHFRDRLRHQSPLLNRLLSRVRRRVAAAAG